MIKTKFQKNVSMGELPEHLQGFLRVPEIARKYNVDRITVIRNIKAGRLKAYKFNTHYRIDPKDLADFVNRNFHED